MRTIQGMLVLVAALLMAACGGSNSVCYGGPGSTECDTTTTATSLTIQLNKSSISDSGSETVTATATAATAGGQTVSGVPVTFSVDSGATFTPSSTTTSTLGIVTAVVSIGPNRANRTITVVATSGGLSATASFAVTGATLTSTAVPGVVAPASVGNKVLFVLKDSAGSAMADQAISIVAGPVGSANGMTDSNGAYTFTYTAPATTGALSVIAKAGGVEKVQEVQVQTTSTVPPATSTPTSATVNANPSVVAPNVDATTSNRVEVRALFRDAGNRAIANMRVRFFANGYGTFATEGNIVYSDGNGMAITGFIPGKLTSPSAGVTITACYSKVDFIACTDSGVSVVTTTLTVAADPLSITIGTDNKVVVSDLTYIQRFIVTAVDIAGRPKANVEITPSIDLQYFLKGQYTFSGGQWVSVCTDAVACPVILPGPIGCPNEDIDRTGFYQASQDVNQNGQIDPRKSDVTVAIEGGTSKTDANGQVKVKIEYAKNLGSWLQYQILISAGVAGTEGRTTWVDVLGVPISDIKAEGAPAFVRSAYGVVTVTAVPSVNFPPPAVPRGAVPPCQNAD